MRNGLYTEEELLTEIEGTGYLPIDDPKHLISAMNQHGMLKDGVDDKILHVLILQFSNSIIGKMDTSNPYMGDLFPAFNMHETSKQSETPFVDTLGAPMTQADYEKYKLEKLTDELDT